MFLLFAPAFYLSFSGFSFGSGVKFLGIKESLRSVLACVMSPLALEMLRQTSLYVGRDAGVESPILVLRYV